MQTIPVLLDGVSWYNILNVELMQYWIDILEVSTRQSVEINGLMMFC